MPRIHSLKIKNYRSIECFEQIFINQNFVCLIGRGDSGKTTILNAIASVLSPQWNLTFNDTDFYNCDIDTNIVIEVSLVDIPEDLLSESKYGLHKRLLVDGDIEDDILEDEDQVGLDLLTIRLTVNQDLEPLWVVTNERDQDDKVIRAGDRAKFNVFLVSDYLDRHFSWGKGTPLYSLLKKEELGGEADKLLAKVNREVKESIQDDAFDTFSSTINNLAGSASDLGLSIEEIKAFVDFKNSIVTEGSITIHSQDLPFRLKGKGTKRLLSIAIQLELAKKGGIILIDEIEQGLEPDRVKHLVDILRASSGSGQTFITTHSSNVIQELSCNELFLKKKDGDYLIPFNNTFQGCLRNNPNAFFAKRVIVCEGATEVGICRSLNRHRVKDLGGNNFQVDGISIVDGNGSAFIDYCKKFNEAGFDVCAFCDSDIDGKKGINAQKDDIKKLGIKVVDCETGLAIEEQIFKDLPKKKLKKLIEYISIEKSKEESILSVTGEASIDVIFAEGFSKKRTLLGSKSKEKGWLKRIDHGGVIGDIWFSSLEEISGKKIEEEYLALNKWMDG